MNIAESVCDCSGSHQSVCLSVCARLRSVSEPADHGGGVLYAAPVSPGEGLGRGDTGHQRRGETLHRPAGGDGRHLPQLARRETVQGRPETPSPEKQSMLNLIVTSRLCATA